MFLITKKSHNESMKLTNETESLEQSLKDSSLSRIFHGKLQEINNSLKEFETKVKEAKQRKYNYDAREYASSHLYEWCLPACSNVGLKKKRSLDSSFHVQFRSGYIR